MTTNQQNHFVVESAMFDEKVKAFLAKFENGGLERLIEKWAPHYFPLQTDVDDAVSFKSALRADVLECLNYVSKPRNEASNDWEEVARIQAMKERYKGLLNDESVSSPKQDEVIATVGIRERFLSILGK